MCVYMYNTYFYTLNVIITGVHDTGKKFLMAARCHFTYVMTLYDVIHLER